jgi:1-acyl-sn-glycerol-3-phosphate acyltransferase
MLTIVGAVLITLIVAPPMLLVSVFPGSKLITYRLSRCWAWGMAKCMGLSFSLYGSENVVPGQSYIVTPNHQSNTDILALVLKLPFPYHWVIKKELLKIPLFGWALGATGAISLNRADRSQAVKSLRAGTQQIDPGWSVLIYPEGTRTPDGNLLPFKKGAFMMAVETGIPILPVTSNGAYKIMSRHSILFRSGHITVTVGEPITTEGLTEEDVPELMRKTREAIGKNLDPTYDPFEPPVSPAA